MNKAQTEESRRRLEETFKLDPIVPIKLKGNNYTLEFNNFAVKEVMKQTGFNIMAKSFGMSEMENPEILGSLLFQGLLTNHPDLTQDSVDKLFTYRHYPYILERLRMALTLFMPDISDLQPREEGVTETELDPTKRLALVGSGTGQ